MENWTGVESDKFEGTAKEEAISTHALDALVDEYVNVRSAYEKAKQISTELYHNMEEREDRLKKTLDALGKSKYFVDGVGTILLVNKLTVRTPKDQTAKRAFFGYVKDTHGEDMVWEMITVNHNSLNSFYSSERDGKEADFRLPGVPEVEATKELRFNRAK